MSIILAIDQSTSATKAILYDTAGLPLDTVSVDHRQYYPRPGWVEHDAEEIWRNTLEALDTLLGRNADRVGELLCVAITNQRETIVVFDRRTGRPLHNAIVWQCRRGHPICRELLDAGHGNAVRRLTGLKIDTYFSASKLKWLVLNEPEIAAELRNGEALIGTMDAYLIYRLTGQKTFATDHTNAARTLLFDISRLVWDDGLCELFDVPAAALPEVRESFADFGRTDLGGLLPAPLPIRGVMGDSQASLFAQRCFEVGDAKATIGTGSSLLLNIGPELRFTESGAVTTIAWVRDGEATYSFEGIINYAAATVEWLKNQLGLIADAAESESLATAVEDNGGVYLVPAFAGLSAPYWQPSARAAILGMTAHSTRNHVVRAALESIAYQIRDVLEMMQTDACVVLRSIRADGGAVANRFLMQFIADMTSLEISVSDVAAASPAGAALAAALGSGVYRSLDEIAAVSRDVTLYSPRMPAEQVTRYYDEWKRAVARVL